MTVNPLSLPTNPDRSAVFAAARGTAPFFDERLKLWVVLDHEKVGELLLDERLVAPDIRPGLAAMEQRYNISLANLIWVVGELPLLLNGLEHKRRRSGMAKLLAADKKTGGGWRDSSATLIRSTMARPGAIEAFRDLLLPIVNTVFANLTQIDVSFEPLTLTRIFDRYASYQHLLSLEQHIATLRTRLADAGIAEESIGAHAALVILGRDSLLASMAEGLIDFAQGCRGKRLDDPAVRSPRLFGGVAIAERRVTTTFAFAGVEFEAGQLVRLYFQGFGQLESETDRMSMFGAGEHSCIGRALGLEVWSLFAAELRKVHLTLHSVTYEYERHSIFTMPRFVNLELT